LRTDNTLSKFSFFSVRLSGHAESNGKLVTAQTIHINDNALITANRNAHNANANGIIFAQRTGSKRQPQLQDKRNEIRIKTGTWIN